MSTKISPPRSSGDKYRHSEKMAGSREQDNYTMRVLGREIRIQKMKNGFVRMGKEQSALQ
ncbi:unnamed protein product, partial [Amoebophrya sp. A25]|eukprot:GSA25T00027485001.1